MNKNKNQWLGEKNELNLLKEPWVINKDTVNSSLVAVEVANSFNSIPNFNLQMSQNPVAFFFLRYWKN